MDRYGSSNPRMKIAGIAIAASSALVRTLSGRGRRNRSIACMSDATVLAFPGRRADRRSTSISESGAAATSAEPSPWASMRR
jgi:hypothetical protein